jgi:hypothetical protein
VQVLAINLGLFLQDCLPDTLTLWQRDQWLVSLANNKHIGDTGSKGVSGSVLDVHNVVRTLMLFLVDNYTHTAVVMASSDHAQVANVEFDIIFDLTSFQIEHYCVILANLWVWVAHCATVVGGNVWYTSLAELHTSDLAEFVAGLLRADAVDNKAALGVVDETEVLVGLGDANDVHETDWVSPVGADLVINLYQTVHEDGSHLFAS